MQRKFEFSVDEFYHLYNRGTEKRPIFLDNSDYNRFLRSLFLLNTREPMEIRNHGGKSSVGFWGSKKRREREKIVDIGAYCLMTNHFHLLVREKVEGGLSLFMKKLLTSYSMYFNLKHKRTGALFEGPFKAKHADDDNYLHYLFAYIHLNPIKIAFPAWPESAINDIGLAKRHLENYAYSSYLDYAGQAERPEGLILNRQAFPDYFQKPGDFGTFLADWVRYQNPTEDSPPGLIES